MDNVVKELINLCPSHNKEIRMLSGKLHKMTLTEIYNRILRIKMSNKDALYFLNIMNKYPRDLDTNLLVSFRCQSNDKYTSQCLAAYFNLVVKYFYTYTDDLVKNTVLSSSNKIDMFLKFVYIFEEDISREIQIYNTFKVFLREEFFNVFLANKCYKKFAFLKEFLVDFADRLGDRIVEIGYECEAYKQLVYEIKGENYIIDWSSHAKFVEIFYHNNCVKYKLDKADVYLLEDFMSEMTYDLSEYAEKNEKENNTFIFDEAKTNNAYEMTIQKRKEKEEFLEIVEKINNLKWNKNYKDLDFRALHLTSTLSLKSWGEILCKLSNIEILKKWCGIFNFEGLSLLKALRIFLRSFQLSGESQVIDRVIKEFAQRYVECNEKKEFVTDELVVEYFKIAYSFVFLNTMLYKVPHDKKMTFPNYYSKTETTLFTEEEMKAFYDDVYSNEIKFPMKWVDTYEKYLVSKDLVSKDTFVLDINTVFAAYKYLFVSNIDCFLKCEIKQHYKLCKMFNRIDLFVDRLNYMFETKEEEVNDVLEGCGYLLKSEKMDKKAIELIVGALHKIEKPKKTSMFKRFGSSKKIGVLYSGQSVYNWLISIEMGTSEIFEHNTQKIQDETDSEFIQQFVNGLILNNLELLRDFSVLDEETKYKYVMQKPEKFKFLSGDEKLEVLQNVYESSDSALHKTFISYLMDNDALLSDVKSVCKYFDILLLASNKYALTEEDSIEFYNKMFESVVSYEKEKEGAIVFTEKMENAVKSSTPFLKWICSHKTNILSVNWLKNIVKREELKNEQIDFYKITYLLSKLAILSDSKSSTYESAWLDVYADDLVVFSQLIQFLLNHNFYINGINAPINIKNISKIYSQKLKTKLNTYKTEENKQQIEEMQSVGRELYNCGFLGKASLNKLNEITIQKEKLEKGKDEENDKDVFSL